MSQTAELIPNNGAYFYGVKESLQNKNKSVCGNRALSQQVSCAMIKTT